MNNIIYEGIKDTFQVEYIEELELVISNDIGIYKIDYLQRNIFERLQNKQNGNKIVLENFYITNDGYVYSNFYKNFINNCSLNKNNLDKYKQIIKGFSINKFVIITEQKYLFYDIMLGYDKQYIKDIDSFIFNNILKRYRDNFKK